MRDVYFGDALPCLRRLCARPPRARRGRRRPRGDRGERLDDDRSAGLDGARDGARRAPDGKIGPWIDPAEAAMPRRIGSSRSASVDRPSIRSRSRSSARASSPSCAKCAPTSSAPPTRPSSTRWTISRARCSIRTDRWSPNGGTIPVTCCRCPGACAAPSRTSRMTSIPAMSSCSTTPIAAARTSTTSR